MQPQLKPLQLPLIPPECNWTVPTMADLPSWKGAKRVGMDCETNDRHLKELGIGVRRGAYMVGVSFAIEDGPSYYLPWAHEGGDNLDKEQVLGYLREQAKTFDGDVVGMNLSYDLDYFWEEEINFPEVRFFRDIQIADPLIYELHHNYSLKSIAERYGLPGKNEDKLREAASAYGVHPKSGLWRLPARYVGEYAEDDARNPLRILRRQERLIDEKDLWGIYDLESRVLPVLVRMRRRGVCIDQDKLTQIEDWSLREEAKALAFVRTETGVKIEVGNVWKADSLVPALEYIGIELPRTSSGQKSVSQEVFAMVDHPVTKALARARKVNKLRTSFAASMRTYMTNGRIHCTFNQIARETETGEQKGVRYGRISATNPNLQQQPNPEKEPEIAGEWRKIFLPEEGAQWCIADYSQQEPRWTTHFAAIMDFKGAREMAQRYHDDPTLDNHAMMAELTGLARYPAKTVYLGLCYGEGGAHLCGQLGLPTRWACAWGAWGERTIVYFEDQSEADAHCAEIGEGFVWKAAGLEGQAILDKFDERAPFIGKVAKAAKKRANARGFVTTVLGRRLHFVKENGKYGWTHKAFNRVIQGSAADQMKKSLVEIDAAGYWMMLQVHDEADNSVADRAEGERIGLIMKDTLPARVPFKVDIEIGPSWGEAK